MNTHVDLYPKAHTFVNGSLEQNCWESSVILDNATLFSTVVFPYYTLHQQREFLGCSKSLPIFGVVKLLNFCQIDSVSHCGFTLHALLMRLNNFSYIDWTFWISFSVRHLFFCYFFTIRGFFLINLQEFFICSGQQSFSSFIHYKYYHPLSFHFVNDTL